MKLIIIMSLVILLSSCTHLYKIESTGQDEYILVHLQDHTKAAIGDKVKVFDWVSYFHNKGSKHLTQIGMIRENEVEGTIVQILSPNLAKIHLEDQFKITNKSKAEF
jgi:hypothetical protein